MNRLAVPLLALVALIFSGCVSSPAPQVDPHKATKLIASAAKTGVVSVIADRLPTMSNYLRSTGNVVEADALLNAAYAHQATATKYEEARLGRLNSGDWTNSPTLYWYGNTPAPPGFEYVTPLNLTVQIQKNSLRVITASARTNWYNMALQSVNNAVSAGTQLRDQSPVGSQQRQYFESALNDVLALRGVITSVAPLFN